MSTPQIKGFVEAMEHELEANAHKGDWTTWDDVDKIVEELDYHIWKLKGELNTNRDGNRIKEYLADNANILMFLGNAFKLYD